VDVVQNSADEAHTWVDANRTVAAEAYQRFLDTGEWPSVGELQRHFDQRGIEVSVADVIDSKPRVLNEARLVHGDQLNLQLRHLMWLDNARPMIVICVRAFQRAIDSYLSDVDDPYVASYDRLTEPPSTLHQPFSDRVYKILTREHPSPFGGSGVDADAAWRIQVDTRFARQFRDLHDIEDLVARQDSIRAKTGRQAAAFVGSTPLPGEDGITYTSLFDPKLAVTIEESGNELGVPEQAPLLFISWGRATSKAVASKLKDMLEVRLPGVELFFSPTSIEPGADPSRRMFDEGLLAASALLVVLTAESAKSAYVIWETATAWARGQLVIPLFVDIEPTAVPGPLTSKIQGVHLADRPDVDRGISQFAVHFGVPSPAPLTDDEHGTLLASAQTAEEDNPEENRAALKRQLQGHLARWQALFAGLEDSTSIDERVELAAEIQQVLLEAVRMAMTFDPDDPLGSALAKIAQRAASVKRIRIYIDGGKSFGELTDGCKGLIEDVEAALA
jgi:TIR domain